MTKGRTIEDDSYNKQYVVDGYRFFLAGSLSSVEDVIERYLAGHYDHKDDDGEAEGFVVTPEGELHSLILTKSKLHVCVQDTKKHTAVGSGEDHAWTAMDLGCSAKEAVKMAAKRDVGTGGRIRTYKLND